MRIHDPRVPCQGALILSFFFVNPISNLWGFRAASSSDMGSGASTPSTSRSRASTASGKNVQPGTLFKMSPTLSTCSGSGDPVRASRLSSIRSTFSREPSRERSQSSGAAPAPAPPRRVSSRRMRQERVRLLAVDLASCFILFSSADN